MIDPKITLEAPEEITVPLVRGDFHATSNIFRLFFEVCLAGASSLVGVLSSIDKPTRLHYIFFGTMALGAVVFAILSFVYHGKSKKKRS